MNLQAMAKDLDRVLYYILLAVLVLNSLIYLFAFTINWEVMFFGIKLDGMSAGIILFMYFFISTLFAYLLLRYPRKIMIIALLSIIFFAFHFIDSAETIQEVSNGLSSYNVFMAFFMMTPLVVLIGHLFVVRFYESEEYSGEKNED
jgi:hypothetical protein